MAEAPKISLCMITRDEAHCIAQALGSVRDLVDEMIVVDTGSTDGTAELAEHLGAKVFHFKWIDDFAAARNFSMSHATGDWILVLDADEAIAREDHPKIKKLLEDPKACWAFTQRHYTNNHRIAGFVPVRREYPQWERNYVGYFNGDLGRLFPRDPRLQFRGRVHELIEHSVNELPEYKWQKCNIPLHHYGHTPEIVAIKDKRKLYTPLGEGKLSDSPKDWKAHYELGVQYNSNGETEKAIEHFHHSLRLWPSYVPTWVNLGYVLTDAGKHREAISALLGALEIDPKHADAHCNLGVAFMRQNDFISAEKSFRRAVNLQPNYLNALSNWSKSLVRLGRWIEAALTLNKLKELSPFSANVESDLGALYFINGEVETAEKHLRCALELDPAYSLTYLYLGNIMDSKKNNHQAAELLEQFCVLEETKKTTSVIEIDPAVLATTRERLGQLKDLTPAV